MNTVVGITLNGDLIIRCLLRVAASFCVQWHGLGCNQDAQMLAPHYPSIPMHPVMPRQYRVLLSKDSLAATLYPLPPKADPRHSMHVPT